MNDYSFDDFLERMSHENYIDILRKAENEGHNLEKNSSGVKGCVDRRRKGSTELSLRIGEFLFFMRFGKKPASVSKDDFNKYKLVVQALVAKRQLKPDILKMFEEDEESI